MFNKLLSKLLILRKNKKAQTTEVLCEDIAESLGTRKPKRIVSTGDIFKLNIPESLSYYEALMRLKKELKGTGITLDLTSFYTETPIELHNCVDSFTYNFIVVDGIQLIAYEINRHGSDYSKYYEIDYNGATCFECWNSDFYGKSKGEEGFEKLERVNNSLGLYGRFLQV